MGNNPSSIAETPRKQIHAPSIRSEQGAAASTMEKYSQYRGNAVNMAQTVEAFAVGYTKTRGTTRVSARVASWFSRTVYEIYYSSSYAGFNFNLRVWNTVSTDSEIIRTVEQGNLAEMMELFDSGKASPFDRDVEGNSLLFVSH